MGEIFNKIRIKYIEFLREKKFHFLIKFFNSLNKKKYSEFSRLAEQKGYHIVKTGMYSPIPIVDELTEKTFSIKPNYYFDWNEENQLRLLENLGKYSKEFTEIKENNIWNYQNKYFGGHDASIYYTIIRHFKPKKIIEVGAGHSTKLAPLLSSK